MLRERTIKDIETYPGPMEGLMSPAFVEAVNQLNLLDCWMTPFLRIGNNIMKQRYIIDFLKPFFSGNIPVILQIMGNNPEMMAESAKLAVELNVKEININFGCPSKKVVTGFAGGGGLRDLILMKDIINQCKEAIYPLPLTVKIRSGWKSAVEMDNIFSILQNVDKIYFHYRTVKENYQVIDNNERIKRFKYARELTPKNIPLILNGDINTKEDALNLLNEIDANGVMCGRGWLKDPWLLKRISSNQTVSSDLEKNRNILYQKVKEVSPTISKGNLIELSNLLWGGKEHNPYFKELCDK